jgi:hypothetical protein
MQEVRNPRNSLGSEGGMEKVNSNPSKLNTSAHSVPQYTRRTLIKSAAAVASAAFDPRTLDAFVHQWTFFADRYKGTPSERLSFNLLNEPIVPPNAAEVAEIQKHGAVQTSDFFSSEMLQRHAKDYTRVAKAARDAIRAHDPQRLIVTDRLSRRRFTDSGSIRHRHLAERPHLQPNASHPP